MLTIETEGSLSPPAEQENPEAMMAAYKATKDLQIRNQLVLHYAPAVKHTIINMRATLPQNIQQEEFFNQGILTLIDCIEKYNPDRGASFTTFIYKHLRGAMLSYMRKHSWLPYRVRTARRSILQARAELNHQLMREPSEKELAAYMQISEGELSRSLQEIGAADMISFEELINGAGGGLSSAHGSVSLHGEESFSDILGDSVDREMLREELVAVLAKAIEQLSPKEKQVVTLCYYENLNLREIGDVLRVSQQRISFIRSGALVKLRKAIVEYMYGKEEEQC
ncbi:MAG: FliA/WhiG family RNA polymerase sigma factor [Clostridiales bacterium]|nr:FliA/WhiG family RNA polymerase sigma factor [Clostridiales bacterium]